MADRGQASETLYLFSGSCQQRLFSVVEVFMQPSDDEKKIASVFEELGRLKILAKTNHLCCGGCAHSDLYQRVKDSEGKYAGYAFYHEQDDERVRDAPEDKGQLYIGFGSLAESVRASESLVVGWVLLIVSLFAVLLPCVGLGGKASAALFLVSSSMYLGTHFPRATAAEKTFRED